MLDTYPPAPRFYVAWSVPTQFLAYGPHLLNAYWNELNVFIPEIRILCYSFFAYNIVLYTCINGAFIKLPGEQEWYMEHTVVD